MRMVTEIMLVPEGVWLEEINSDVIELNSEFDTVTAGNLPPHVVLKELGYVSHERFVGAYLKLNEIAEITREFEVQMGRARFHIRGKGYGIYAEVIWTPELARLHRTLVSTMKKYSDGADRSWVELENFEPCMMLVGQDISAEYREMARKKYGNMDFAFGFPARSITIMRHPGRFEPNQKPKEAAYYGLLPRDYSCSQIHVPR